MSAHGGSQVTTKQQAVFGQERRGHDPSTKGTENNENQNTSFVRQRSAQRRCLAQEIIPMKQTTLNTSWMKQNLRHVLANSLKNVRSAWQHDIGVHAFADVNVALHEEQRGRPQTHRGQSPENTLTPRRQEIPG